jgi:hypothetical protein
VIQQAFHVVLVGGVQMTSTRQVLRSQYVFVKAMKRCIHSCKYISHVAMQRDSLHAWEGRMLGHNGCFPPPTFKLVDEGLPQLVNAWGQGSR